MSFHGNPPVDQPGHLPGWEATVPASGDAREIRGGGHQLGLPGTVSGPVGTVTQRAILRVHLAALFDQGERRRLLGAGPGTGSEHPAREQRRRNPPPPVAGGPAPQRSSGFAKWGSRFPTSRARARSLEQATTPSRPPSTAASRMAGDSINFVLRRPPTLRARRSRHDSGLPRRTPGSAPGRRRESSSASPRSSSPPSRPSGSSCRPSTSPGSG